MNGGRVILKVAFSLTNSKINKTSIEFIVLLSFLLAKTKKNTRQLYKTSRVFQNGLTSIFKKPLPLFV